MPSLGLLCALSRLLAVLQLRYPETNLLKGHFHRERATFYLVSEGIGIGEPLYYAVCFQ